MDTGSRQAALPCLRVLLVDDSELFAGLAARYLVSLGGIRVVGQAKTCSEALLLAGETSPDLILMDYAMPGTNGLECARCLRALDHAGRIVMISVRDVAAVAAHPMDGFVSKWSFTSGIGRWLAAARQLGSE